MLNDCNKVSDILVDDVLVVPVWDDDDDDGGRGWYTEAKCSSCSSVKTWSEPVLSSSSSVAWDEYSSLSLLRWVWENFFVCLSEPIRTMGVGGVSFGWRKNWLLKFVGVVSSPSGEDRPLVLANIPAGKTSVRSKHELSNCSGRFNRFIGGVCGFVLGGEGGNCS